MNHNKLPELAADLVRRRVTVIVTPIGTPAALAGKAATTTIPIIFSAGSDPVAAGLVASFKQPGSNVTGINFMSAELGAKRLGLLHELRPGATRISLLINPNNPITVDAVTKEVSAEPPPLVAKSRSSPPAPIVTSTSPLRRWCKSVPTRS